MEQAQRIVGALESDEGNALAALGVTGRALNALEKVDPDLVAWRELLDAGYANLSELARLAAEYAGSVQEDPDRLGFVERRRDLLFRLSGKYGPSLDLVLETRDQAAAELELLDTAELDLRSLAARRTAAEALLQSAAGGAQCQA